MNCSYYITVGYGKVVVLKYVIQVDLVIKGTEGSLIPLKDSNY